MLEKEYPGMLTSLNNIAVAIHHQGKYADAEEINRQVLELFEKY